MGVIQNEALKTTVLSSLGLLLGYFNKAVLFLILLSPSQVGLVNLTVTVALLFSQFSNFGTIYSVWRFFPFFRNKEKNNYGFLKFNILIILVGVLFCSILVVVFKNQIFNLYSQKSPLFVDYYLWIIPIGIAHVYYVLFDNYLRGLYKNFLSVLANEIFLRIIVTFLLGLLYFKIINFHQFFILHAFSYTIPLLVLTIYLYKINELDFNFTSIQIPRRFRRILLYFNGFSYLNTLAVLLVISMDAMMIAHYLDLRSTGIYTTIIYMTSAAMIPYRSMIRVSSPLVAELWKKKDLSQLQILYQKSSSIGLLFGLTIFLIIWFPINELFYFIPEYKEGIYVFLFLMGGRMIDMYCGLNGTIFSTSRKFKYDLLFSIFLCVSVFFLNIWLIPFYGIVGAALSTGFAYVIYNILRCWYIFKIYKLHPFKLKQLWLFLFFTSFLLLILFLNQTINFDSWKIPVLLIVFLKILFVVLGFILPVYFLNIEPNTNEFISAFFYKIRGKKATSNKK